MAGGTELKFCACIISNQLSAFQVHGRSDGGRFSRIKAKTENQLFCTSVQLTQVTEVSKVTHLLLSIISLNTYRFRALQKNKYLMFIFPRGNKHSTTELCPQPKIYEINISPKLTNHLKSYYLCLKQ